MPKRTNPFQHLVFLIESATRDVGARVTESKELLDSATNTKREVDIVIETKVGTHDCVIGIECTNQARPANTEWIERMWGKHQSLSTHRLVLVSGSGFTDPARQKAKQLKIEALTLQEANQNDWESAVRRLSSVSVEIAILPYAETIQLVLSGNPYGDDWTQFSTAEVRFCNSSGSAESTVEETIEECLTLLRGEFDRMDMGDLETCRFNFERRFKEGSYVKDQQGRLWPVLALQFSGCYRRCTSRLDLKRALYENIHVAHGTARILGVPVEVVAVQRPGDDAITLTGRMPKRIPGRTTS